MVDFVSQLKINWGALKRKSLFPFGVPFTKIGTHTAPAGGGSLAPVVGHACINWRVLKSLIKFPLPSISSHLMGTAEFWLTAPEKVGAVGNELAVLSGCRKPMKMHGTDIGGFDVFEGTLSRVPMVPVIPVVSVITVVTKYVKVPQLTVESMKLKVVGSGSGVPGGTGTVGLGGNWLKGPPFFER